MILVLLALAMAQTPLRLLDVVCHYSCLSCEGPTEYDCVDCAVGNRQYGFGACPCEPGYYEQSQICEQCASSCSTCIEAAKCLTCTPPLALSASTCACPARTYLNSGRCSRCHTSCYSCSGRLASECATCADNRELLGSQCPCKEGYFDQQGCKVCLIPCKTCTIGTECETCRDDRELDANRQCACKTNYFETNMSTCGVCHESCLTCKDVSEFGCLQCQDGKLVDAFGRCACPLGQYADANGCLTCDESCLACVGSGPANCTDCSTVAHRTTPKVDGSCACNDGFYEDDYLGLCIRCHSHCLTCRGPYRYHCVTCPDGQNLETGICVCEELRQGVECVAQCGQRYYQVGKECLPCHQFCDSCTSPHLSDCVCSFNETLTDIELQHDGYRGYVITSASLDAQVRQFTCKDGNLKPFTFDASKYDYSWSFLTADGVEIDTSRSTQSQLHFEVTLLLTPTQYRVVYTLSEKTGSSVSTSSIEFESYIPFIAAFIIGGDRQLSTQTTHSIALEVDYMTEKTNIMDFSVYTHQWTCNDCMTTSGDPLPLTADSFTLEIAAGSFKAGQQISVQASIQNKLNGAKAVTASATLTFVGEVLPDAILSISLNNYGRYINPHEILLASILAVDTTKPQVLYRMRSGGTTYSPPVDINDWMTSFRLQDHLTEFASTVELEFSYFSPQYFAAATFKRQIKVNPPLADCKLLVTGGPLFKIQVDGCSVGSIPLVYQFYYYLSDADRAKDYVKGLLVEAVPLTNPQYASHTETILVAGNGVVLARIQDYLGGYTNLTAMVTVQQDDVFDSLVGAACPHCAAELIVSSSSFQKSKSYDSLAATLWTTYNNTYDRARVRISTKLMQRQILQQKLTNASISMDVFANQSAQVRKDLLYLYWYRPNFLRHVVQDRVDRLLSHLHCLYRLLDVYNQGIIPFNNSDAFMNSHNALQELNAVSLSCADRNDAAFTDTLTTVTYFNQKVDRDGLTALLGVDAIVDPLEANVKSFVLLRTDYTHNYFGNEQNTDEYIMLPSSTATMINIILLYDTDQSIDLEMQWRQPTYKQIIPYHFKFDHSECPTTQYVCMSRSTRFTSPWISYGCGPFQSSDSGEGVCNCLYSNAITAACQNQTQQASQNLPDTNEEEEDPTTDGKIVEASAPTSTPASSITWSQVPLIYISSILIASFIAAGVWGAYKDHRGLATVVPEQPLSPYLHIKSQQIMSQQLSPQNRLDKRSQEQSVSVFPPQKQRFQFNNLPQSDGNEPKLDQHDTIQQNVTTTQQLGDNITSSKPTIRFTTYLARQHPLSLSYDPNYSRLFRSLMNLHTLFLDLASALYFGKNLEAGSFITVIVLCTLGTTTQRLIIVKTLTHSNSIVKALGGLAFIGLAEFSLYVIVYAISIATQQDQPNSWSIQFCVSYLIENAFFQVGFAYAKYRSARIRNLFQ